MVSNTPRIAIFERNLTLNIEDINGSIADNPSTWAASFESPKWNKESWNSNSDRPFVWTVSDDRVVFEIHRLIVHRTCPLCRIEMYQFPPNFQSGIVVLCQKCGYCGCRGTGYWGGGPTNCRGVLGRYKPLNMGDEDSFEILATHFAREREALLKMSPFRAEKFVVDLISETLNCETKQIGGVKDGGVDGYIVRGNQISSIIQVKWRQSTKGAEAVSVVREVAGTMVARGIPEGILVSTRQRYSKDAIKDAELIGSRYLDGLGKLSLTLLDYNNLLDMLEIANLKLKADIQPEEWIPIEKDDCVFDGRFYDDPSRQA